MPVSCFSDKLVFETATHPEIGISLRVATDLATTSPLLRKCGPFDENLNMCSILVDLWFYWFKVDQRVEKQTSACLDDCLSPNDKCVHLGSEWNGSALFKTRFGVARSRPRDRLKSKSRARRICTQENMQVAEFSKRNRCKFRWLVFSLSVFTQQDDHKSFLFSEETRPNVGTRSRETNWKGRIGRIGSGVCFFTSTAIYLWVVSAHSSGSTG